MAYTTINKSTDYFNTKLYSGNGSTQTITGVGFQPDMVWTKARSGTSATENHFLYDAVRGATKPLIPNGNTAEQTQATSLTSFDSDGFTSGAKTETNGANTEYVAWNWKAGGGQGSSNTDGSINTTYTSVNTTAGFSISQYDGTGSGATVGHGLGATPKIILWKRLDSNDGTVNWIVQSPLLDNRYKVVLNTTEAKSTNSSFANVDNWSNSVFTVGTYEGQNDSNGTYIAYCFAEKTGYSKFGSYTGNGNADGSFVYTGFKPSFLMVKRTDSTSDWLICDNKRNNYSLAYTQNNFNVVNGKIFANLSQAEEFYNSYDFVSNGFKIRSSGTGHNASGANMIYMAFGQSLVGSNNVPCTAR